VHPLDLHHIGHAVSDLDAAVDLYERMFGAVCDDRATLAEQGVHVAALLVGASRLELMAPTEPDTPVGRFLAKRGPGMHHVAYEVGDIREALAEADAAGAQLIDPEPRSGLHGLQVAFIHPESVAGVLVELVETRGGSDGGWS
jgi:methylmalonyl-CoA/ethylmalonyl-CoA epimerase